MIAIMMAPRLAVGYDMAMVKSTLGIEEGDDDSNVPEVPGKD